MGLIWEFIWNLYGIYVYIYWDQYIYGVFLLVCGGLRRKILVENGKYVGEGGRLNNNICRGKVLKRRLKVQEKNCSPAPLLMHFFHELP